MKAIVIYYSYLGNTKGIAEKIQKETGADIARIETVVPYEGDYNKVVDQGQDETTLRTSMKDIEKWIGKICQ